MPLRRWDIEHVDLEVRLFPDERRIEGRTVHHIQPLQPHGTFRLHQEHLEIREVTVDGAVVEPRIGDGIVDIPVEAGSEHQVAITYAARPERGLWFRSKKFGHRSTEVWSQGEGPDNRHWFPSWDYPNDLFTVKTKVVAPQGLVVRANGEMVLKADVGDTTEWTFELEQPIVNYLIALVAGDYQVHTGEAAGVKHEILGPRWMSEKELLNGASRVDEMLPYYNELLGTPYPYPVYRQIFVQSFLYGGMENATVTTITDERTAKPGNSRVVRTEGVVAHELAHHWFGDLLTCYGWRELWLNEGFATYYEQRWKEQVYGADHWAAARVRTRARARDGSHPMSARSHSKKGADNSLVYVRGASVLHALEAHFGRDVFDAVIRRWVAENQHRLVESEGLRRLFEDATGEHLGWLWDQWVTGSGAPTWKASWSWEDGQLVVQIDPQHGSVFHTPVEIEVDGHGTEKIWLGDGRAKLVLKTENAPRFVAIDPRAAVIGTFEMDQANEAWTAQLLHSPSPVAQIDAMQALHDSDHDPAIEAMATILNGQRDGYFRKYAAGALAQQSTDAAAEALMTALTDEDEQIRDRAARGLRNHERKPARIRALRERLEQDEDEVVRAVALGSLAELLGDGSRRLLLDALNEGDGSYVQNVRVEALDLLAERGKLGDVDDLLRYTSRSHPRWVRVAAMDTIAALLDKAEPDDRKRMQRVFIEKISPLLTHPDLRIRQAVVRSFSAAHPDDLPILERFARATQSDHERQRAERVLAEHGKPGEPEPDDLEKRIEALESRLDAAGDRLEALEEWRR